MQKFHRNSRGDSFRIQAASRRLKIRESVAGEAISFLRYNAKAYFVAALLVNASARRSLLKQFHRFCIIA